ncbi:MAG: hypothetical protein D6776_07905 [Planctomycetota bacterium]|nr:MAG: hypothetical protein D6776_07905 [Planctomycetota bacterium]
MDISAARPPGPAPVRQPGRAEAASSPDRAAEAGRMFENLLLRLVVSQLRKTMSLDGEGGGAGLGGSLPGKGIYGSLLDTALADAISGGGGIGLGDLVAARLRGRGAEDPDREEVRP